MIIYPNAKINLGLKVLNKRSDGFHNIESVMYPVGMSDILEVSVKKELDVQTVSGYDQFKDKFLLRAHDMTDQLTFIQENTPEGLAPEDNLCFKAFNLFMKDKLQVPIKFYLHLLKLIPDGAGLGGGSSDAVSVIAALNELMGKPHSQQELSSMSALLGSDCPFFIKNVPMLANGKGDQLTELKIDLSGYWLVIVSPDIKVNTAWAYQQIQPSEMGDLPSEIVKSSVESWQEKLINDFEIPVIRKYPVIQEIKQTLLTNGALFASMTGSGSSVYGIFKEPMNLNNQFKDHKTYIQLL